MADSFLPPLTSQEAIVDKDGKPTIYFQRFMQQLQAGPNIAVNNGVVDVSGVLTYIDGNGDGSVPNPTGWVTGEWRIMPTKDFVVENRNTHVFLEFDPDTYANGVMWGGDAAFAQVWGLGIPSAAGRFQLLGSAAFEFLETPYVINDKIFHAGNLIFGTNLTYNAGTGVLDAAGGGGSHPWYWSPPLVASMTAVSGDATLVVMTDSTNVGLRLACGTSAGANVIRGAFQALTSAGATAFSKKVRIEPAGSGINGQNGFGLILRESATGKITNIGPVFGSRYDGYYGTMTSYTGAIGSSAYGTVPPYTFLRADFDGVNLYSFYESADGEEWALMGTVARATAFTTRADQVGIGFVMTNAGRKMVMACPYFV